MADAHTGMGPLTPAPKLNPHCQCICHTQPGVMHVAACCTAPDLIPRADAELAVAEAIRRAADLIVSSAYTSNGDRRSLEPVAESLRGADQHHATIAAAILALAPADALAEVQRLRARMEKLRDTIKKAANRLDWCAAQLDDEAMIQSTIWADEARATLKEIDNG